MEAELLAIEGASSKPLAGSPFKDVLYGSVSPFAPSLLDVRLKVAIQAAGIVSKLVEHPLDLVKVRLREPRFTSRRLESKRLIAVADGRQRASRWTNRSSSTARSTA